MTALPSHVGRGVVPSRARTVASPLIQDALPAKLKKPISRDSWFQPGYSTRRRLRHTQTGHVILSFFVRGGWLRFQHLQGLLRFPGAFINGDQPDYATRCIYILP